MVRNPLSVLVKVSASTGANIVRVFEEAINLSMKNKEEPEDEVRKKRDTMFGAKVEIDDNVELVQ